MAPLRLRDLEVRLELAVLSLVPGTFFKTKELKLYQLFEDYRKNIYNSYKTI